jgi:hypothetical protein
MKLYHNRLVRFQLYDREDRFLNAADLLRKARVEEKKVLQVIESSLIRYINRV